MNALLQPSGTFQQFEYGPFYPFSLYAENVRNFTQQLVDARRHGIRERKWENRFAREWNALQYIERKRALAFLIRQRNGA